MNWKKILPFIGIILFGYILIKIDLYQVWVEVKSANPFFIGISILFMILLLVVQTFKWFVIARKQQIPVMFKEAFKINLITNLYSLITPSKLGGMMRVEYLKRYTLSRGKGLCNFTLDKMLDLTSVFFITIVFSLFLREKLSFLPLKLFTILFFVFVLITLIFISKNRSRILLRGLYRKFIPQKLKEKVKVTFDSFYENMPKKRYFIFFFFLNLVNWVVVYAVSFFIGKALGIELAFIYFLAILPIGTLVSMLPISINGLGTREATLISLFALFGIGSAKVFSLSLLFVVIGGIIPALLAIPFMFRQK